MTIKYNAMAGRAFTRFATEDAKCQLNVLLTANTSAYQSAMRGLGELLAHALIEHSEQRASEQKPSDQVTHQISQNSEDVLMVSTAEDADFLQLGINQYLSHNGISTKLAVFWNHHYQLSDNSSVAPIVHKYLQVGYETCSTMVVVKSILSGSCVVRTNLIELVDKMPNLQRIYILSPVMHQQAEMKLRAEFPDSISAKFEFITFAVDAERTESGEVLPGIGGQVYERLGLGTQPVLTSYLPNVVKKMALET